MPLAHLEVERTRLHLRRLNVEGFKRADGLWDIDARIVDTKDHDFPLSSGLRKSGDAVHDMSVRVTIDGQMNVLAVSTCTDASPYMGACDNILLDYSKLVGLNLFKGFLRAVKEMFGGARGCAHTTELLMLIPTVALQTFSSESAGKDENGAGDNKPYQLDRCHALVTDSETVRRHYPRWYRSPETGAVMDSHEQNLVSSSEKKV